MIEGTAVAASVGRIRAGVFHLETGVVGIPLTADIGIIASAVHRAYIVFSLDTVQHLGVFAPIVEIVSTIVEVEPAVGYLEVFEKLAVSFFSI